MIEGRPYGYYPRFPYKSTYGYGRYNYRQENADVQNRPHQYRDNLYDERKNKGYSRTNYLDEDKKENKNKEPRGNNFTHKADNKILEDENHSPIFEIFGIKLYFDDILLIALIFFLYDEGVQDNMLFIALVLLLLS